MTYSREFIKVLVVEDNEGDFIIIEELLVEEIKQPEIVRAESLFQTIQTLQKDPVFDVILLDLSLPDERGEKLVKKVLEFAGQIPVIVLTGYTDKGFGITALGWGVSDYLMKDDLQSLQLYKSISYGIERKKIYNELSQSEQNYRSLFRLSPIPMWVYDVATLKFLNVNEAAIKHYGYTREEFLSMTIREIRPVEDIPLLEKAIETSKLNKQSYYNDIFRHKKKNNDIIQVEIESNTIEFNDVKAALVLANDITEKLAAEQNLRKSEEELRKLNAELETRVIERTRDLSEANRYLEAFSYSVSHDLKAPLRAIMSFAQILKDEASDQLSDECNTYTDHIINSSKRMSNLITSLLNFSRISRKSVRKNKINTSDLVDIVWQNLSKEHPEKIDFVVNDLPEIEGDSAMIEQVFVNLLSNAVKYSAKKDKQIVEVGSTVDNDEIILYVKDNGAGFDMAYYDQLFEIFKRLHTASDFEGTGVGLSIVKLIIEKHDGRIWAESTPGQGAIFSFALPVRNFS